MLLKNMSYRQQIQKNWLIRTLMYSWLQNLRRKAQKIATNERNKVAIVAINKIQAYVKTILQKKKKNDFYFFKWKSRSSGKN